MTDSGPGGLKSLLAGYAAPRPVKQSAESASAGKSLAAINSVLSQAVAKQRQTVVGVPAADPGAVPAGGSRVGRVGAAPVPVARRWQLPLSTDRINSIIRNMLIIYTAGTALLLALGSIIGISLWAWLPLGLLALALVRVRHCDLQRNLGRTRANFILTIIAALATVALVQLTGKLESPFFILQYLPLLTIGLATGRSGALAYTMLLLVVYAGEFLLNPQVGSADAILQFIVSLAMMPILAFLVGHLRAALLEETEKAKLADSLAAANLRLEKFTGQVNKIIGELGALHEFSHLVGMAWEQDDIVAMMISKIALIAEVKHILIVEKREDGIVVIGTTSALRELVGSHRWAADRGSEEWVLTTAEMLLQPQLDAKDLDRLPGVLRHEFKRPMMVTMPLVVANEVIGAVSLYSEQREELTDRLCMQLLLTTIAQGATSMQNIKTLASLKKSYIEAIRAISVALDAKDPYTRGHSDRVRQYALAAAERYGLSARDREWLEIAAAVHDIGKIGIDDRIIRKDRNLTEEEFAQVRQHPVIGARILGQMVFFEPAIPVMRGHHERWDGKGYPDGLAGEKIPRMARLLAICDTFDAMTSNRTYRAALATEVAIAELEKNKGTQFAPDAVEVFVATLIEDLRLRGEIEERYKVWQHLFAANQEPGPVPDAQRLA